MRAHRPGMDEALGLIDRGSIGERNYRADAGRSHQPATHRIVSDGVEEHLVKRGELLAHHTSFHAVAEHAGRSQMSERCYGVR